MDTKKVNENENEKVNENNPIKKDDKVISRCSKYDEICSKSKLCGDCAADERECDQAEEDFENFKLDSQMSYGDD
jgi:hypothetical protein